MPSRLQQAFDPETFRQQGRELVDRLADYLQAQLSGAGGKTLEWQTPQEELDFWKNWLENPSGRPDFFQTVLDRSIHLHNPRYMGHQVSAPAPLGALAGMVSDLLNNGMAVYEMGKAPTAMEAIVVQTAARAFGWGESAGGHLTSGGTLANLTALLAARRAKAPQDVWIEGHGEPLALMVSEEAHYCIDRAARIMGWGSEGIVKIPSDERFCMKTDLLDAIYEEETRKGKRIIAVVASACSTSTGSYDDMEAIAAFCKKRDLWLHVDGAHGACVAFAPRYRHLVKGIEKADSVTMDFHKMLLAPTLATGLFFRERKYSYQTFSQEAAYLFAQVDEEEWYNVAKRSFECTKLMMSLKVFALLQAYGQELWEEYVTYCYDLARHFARIIQSRKGWELAVEPQSNIVCFRYANAPGPDALNARLREAILHEGDFYIVQTRLRGRVYLRCTLVNPFTKERDLEALLERLESKI
jgi:L-2,4-diaminobutyrate decarboxylase